MKGFIIIFAIIIGIYVGRKIKKKRNTVKPLSTNKILWEELEEKYNEQQPKLYQMSLMGWNHEGRDKYIRKMKAGDPLLFVPDRNNPYDDFAVGVFNLAGDHLGYMKQDSGGIKSFGEQLHEEKIEIYGKLLGFKNDWPYMEFAVVK